MMPSGYSSVWRVRKSALTELAEAFFSPMEFIIVILCDLEIIQWIMILQVAAKSAEERQQRDQPRQVSDLTETQSLTRELCIADTLKFPDKNIVVVLHGVADRFLSIEILLYAQAGDLIDIKSMHVASERLPILGRN